VYVHMYTSTLLVEAGKLFLSRFFSPCCRMQFGWFDVSRVSSRLGAFLHGLNPGSSRWANPRIIVGLHRKKSLVECGYFKRGGYVRSGMSRCKAWCLILTLAR